MTAAGASTSSGPLAVQRIYGADAVGTSIAVSQAEFPSAGSAKTVVLARSDFFSDSLAGGPLAAKLGGPLLTTPGAPVSSSLDPRVQAEIQRVLPLGGTVYLLGGNLALSPGIDTGLRASGYVAQRVAGADKYATAVDIAEQISSASVIFEATGLAFPDALSAGPAAIEDNGVVLLTDGPTQAPETAAYLAAHPSDTRYAVGGPLAAYGADPAATPVYGRDRYGTSAAVAQRFFQNPTVFGAATGASYPDALSGGPFMGAAATKGPVLLVQPSGPLPASIAGYLSESAANLTQGYLFGGPLAVGDDVLSELETRQPTPTLAVELSDNWSGYILGDGPYTYVSGTFNAPSIVSGTPVGDEMSEWVGIDGAGNSSLIQAGIRETVDPHNPSLFLIVPWWEILPAAETDIRSISVAPGDQITVAIEQISPGGWEITLSDDTNGETFTTDQAYTGPSASAEWIVEAPTRGVSTTELATYSPVTFSGLKVAGSDTTLTEAIMFQNGVQVSTPSPLTANGFGVAYGAVAPAAP